MIHIILPEFPFLLPSSGMHPVVFSPFSPGEYLDKTLLVSPGYDVAGFLLLLPFFPSLHGQFNHSDETSTLYSI